jgi:hypothetical protein
VILDVAALHAHVFFQLPLRNFEGVAQSHVQVFVRLFVVVVPAHYEMLLRHGEIDPDAVEVALMLMVVLGGNRDLATDDVVAELLELGHFLAHLGFDGIGMGEAAKGDL